MAPCALPFVTFARGGEQPLPPGYRAGGGRTAWPRPADSIEPAAERRESRSAPRSSAVLATARGGVSILWRGNRRTVAALFWRVRLAQAQGDGPGRSATCHRYSAQLPFFRACLRHSRRRWPQSAGRFRHVRRLWRLRNRGAGHYSRFSVSLCGSASIERAW